MMKLITRETLKRAFMLHTLTDCHVEKFGEVYMIVTDDFRFVPVSGDELKMYTDDIIYFQYTGREYGTGDFILKSDRHGVICKWEEV